METWVPFVVSVAAGCAAGLPLVAALVRYVRRAAREKNWAQVMDLVVRLMAEVEQKMEKGEDKKAYVLAVLKASADTIQYDLTQEDYLRIGELIDQMCDMSKILGGKAAERV